MNDDEWRTMIKNAVEADAFPELDHDLWPRMQTRLAAARPAPSAWDLLLLAAIVLLSIAFPDVLFNMLYHL